MEMKVMTLIYAVFSFPAEKRQWYYEYEEVVLVTLRKMLEEMSCVRYLIVRETGKKGDNPHLNVVLETKTDQKTTSYTRSKLKKFYEQFSIPMQKITLTVKKVDDLEGLLEYLSKEEAAKVCCDEGFHVDLNILREKYLVSHSNKMDIKGGYDIISKASLLDTMFEFMEKHKLKIESYEDFVELVVEMTSKKKCPIDLLSKPKHWYAMLCASFSEDAKDVLRSILINNGSLN